MAAETNKVNDFGFDDDDDDFGDFGGFEGADPVAPQVALPVVQGVTATPSPWALLPGVQPTTETGQEPTPPGADPPALSDECEDLSDSLEPTFTLHSTTKTSATTDPPFKADFEANLGLEVEKNKKETSSDVQGDVGEVSIDADAKTHTVSAPTGAQPSHLPSHPPSTTQEGASGATSTSAPETPERQTLVTSREAGILSDSEETAVFNTSGPNMAVTPEEATPSGRNREQPVPPPGDHQKQKLATLQTTLGTVQAERDIIRKELQSVTSNQERWNRELQECKVQLEQQIEKYDTLQVVHTEALAEMRKTGHEALTVIIEEYKELSRQAVLQQNDLCHQDMKAALTEEATRWQTQLEKQREKHANDLEQMKTSIQEELTKTLETERKEQESKLEQTLQEERQKHEDARKEAIQEEHEKMETALEETLKMEREKLRLLLKEEQDKFKHLLEVERQKSATAISEATTAVQVHCKECMKEALEEERQKGEQRVQEVTEHAQKKMTSYVAEQKQLDNTLRRRQLTTLDLFLESSRKQLDLLLSDPPPGSGDMK